MLEVRYEALVADFEAQARRIIAHCGSRLGQFLPGVSQGAAAAGSYQVRQPLYQTSVGRSRPYAAMLGPLLAALGDDGVNRA